MTSLSLSLLPPWTFPQNVCFAGHLGSQWHLSWPSMCLWGALWSGKVHVPTTQEMFYVLCSCFSFQNEVFCEVSISKLFNVKRIPKTSLKIFHERTWTKVQIKWNRRDVQPKANQMHWRSSECYLFPWQSACVLDSKGPERSCCKPCIPSFQCVPVYKKWHLAFVIVTFLKL